MSKERPILFSGQMANAILEGRKTQTRRVIKNSVGPFWDHPGCYPGYAGDGVYRFFEKGTGADDFTSPLFECPIGNIGDRLWVRETFQVQSKCWTDCGYEYDEVNGPLGGHKESSWEMIYGATSNSDGPWRPSIHMPRWASRITLEITCVRVERLHEISEEDAKAEGAQPYDATSYFNAVQIGDYGEKRHEFEYRAGFAELWDSVGGDWYANQWVWVIEFKRVWV